MLKANEIIPGDVLLTPQKQTVYVVQHVRIEGSTIVALVKYAQDGGQAERTWNFHDETPLRRP